MISLTFSAYFLSFFEYAMTHFDTYQNYHKKKLNFASLKNTASLARVNWNSSMEVSASVLVFNNFRSSKNKANRCICRHHLPFAKEIKSIRGWSCLNNLSALFLCWFMFTFPFSQSLEISLFWNGIAPKFLILLAFQLDILRVVFLYPFYPKTHEICTYSTSLSVSYNNNFVFFYNCDACWIIPNFAKCSLILEWGCSQIFNFSSFPT